MPQLRGGPAVIEQALELGGEDVRRATQRLRDVAEAADNQPLRTEPADIELHREDRAVFSEADGFVASHLEQTLLGPQVRPEPGLDLRAVGFGDQARKVFADDLVGRVAEESLCRRVVGADHQALVDRNDAVGHVVQDGADPRAAALQFFLGTAPLDELADLASDVGHHPQHGRVERAAVMAEEGDDPGHLPAIGHGEGELGVQTGPARSPRARRSPGGDVIDGCGAARPPDSAQQALAAGVGQFLAGRQERAEVF